jgi:hypothetical protein
LTELNFGTAVNKVLAEVAKQVTLRLEQHGRLEGLDGPARAALTQHHRARLADLLAKSLYRELERQGRGEELRNILRHHPGPLETHLEGIWPNWKAFLLEALSQATQRLLE